MARACSSPLLFVFRRRTLSVPALLLIVCAATFAQVDRAVLEGTVTDATGAVISGAGVQALAVDTGISQDQQTNSNGYYRFSGLGGRAVHGDCQEP